MQHAARISIRQKPVDADGHTYSRTYVGRTPEQAITDFIQMIESVDAPITTVSCTTDDKCFFPTYADYTEDQCILCMPESF